MMCRQSVVILSAALAVAAAATLSADDTDIDKTTLELMAEHGYPAEEHLVTTEDGYILALHRMPHGVAGPGEVPRPVAFLQHGLLGSSSDWLMQPPARSLAYMLADAGYDVWLGNVRGNTYCRSHVNLTADQPQFWKFSWDQMGMYDVPAMIDHILQTSGQEDLYYFGHSMGTTMFWVMLYNHPEYNAKIRLMQALGPVARMDRTTCPLRIFAPYANELEKLAEYIGYDEFLPSDELMTYVAETFCEPDEESQFICNDIMFLLGGYDPEQLNETALPVIISHTPAGTSTRTVVHYAQEIDTAAFIHFDWGLAENLARYGQATPPLYSLEHVTCPVVLAWSDNDLLADPQDVAWLADQLPNVVENFRVPLAAFNHLDFIWAIDADTLLYNHLMENLRNY